MFLVLSKLLDVAFSPLFWSLALGVLALLSARWQRTRASRVLALAALLVLYVPATGAFAGALFTYTERFDGPVAQLGAHYDAAVLLGGFAGRRADGAIEVSEAADRLLRSWELVRDRRAERLVIAGGGAHGEEPEADVAADLLRQLGVDPARMLLDRASRNTRENALALRAIVDRERLGRLVLVTSAFHMERALGCLRAVGLTADALATDHQAPEPHGVLEALLPRASYLAQSELALRELAGRLVYRARGFTR